MAEQNDRIVWVGYSWELTARQCCLCVAADDARYVDGQRTKEDPSISHYPLCWQANAEPVPPPPPGVVDTLGVSGIGGYLRESQSHLSTRESEWLEQVKLIDQGFERILADMLTGILNSLLDTHIDGDGNPRRTYVVIQGPAFPKLLGRLGYRRIREQDAGLSVYFLTFRRRFLTPNPLVLEDGLDSTDDGKPRPFGGMIHGPVPSDHEEAAVRKYYVLPAMIHAPAVNASNGNVCGGYSPLMLETFGQNTDSKADKDALVGFLAHLGVRRQNDGTIVAEGNRVGWLDHPSTPAFRRVHVPAPLLEVNQASLQRLREFLGAEPGLLGAIEPDSVPILSLRTVLRLVEDTGVSLSDVVGEVSAAMPDRADRGRSDDEAMECLLRACRDDLESVIRAVRSVAGRRGSAGHQTRASEP